MVSESNEGNNIEHFEIEIRKSSGGDGPDLIVEDLTILGMAEGDIGPTITSARRFWVTYASSNRGNEPVDGHYTGEEEEWGLNFLISTDRTPSSDDKDIGGMVQPNARYPADWNERSVVDEYIGDDLPPGDYYFLVVADGDRQVAESNESNNVDSFAFTLVGEDEEVGLTVAPDLLLEGAYTAEVDMMNDRLGTETQIPLSQPYARENWNYKGSEVVGTLPQSSLVDWVLLELRTGDPSDPPMKTIARRAAFLKSDGSVVELDGESPVYFHSVSAGDYYLVMRHRNHLPVMSSEAVNIDVPISVTYAGAEYDFTSGRTQAYGATAMKDLGDGTYGLRAGDADANGQIQTRDKNVFWKEELGESGYDLSSDFNLNGQTEMEDKNVAWANAVGNGAFVPQSVIASSSSELQRSEQSMEGVDSPITFNLANSELVETDSGRVFAFDIQATATEGESRLGDTQIYLDYDTTAFGQNLSASRRISVDKGALLQGQESSFTDAYELVNIADNTSSKVSIVHEYKFPDEENQGAVVSATPKRLMRVYIDTDDNTPDSSLNLDQELMQGNQFQSDNATVYDPVRISDTPPVEPVSVSLPDASGTAGSEALLPVTVDDLGDKNVRSYDFTVSYDAGVLDLTGVSTNGTLSDGLTMQVNTDTPGEIAVSASGTQALAGSGTLVNLEAEYVAEGTSALAWQSFTFNEGTPAANGQDGSVDVSSVAYGDVTGDGAISAYDASFVLRSAVDLTALPGDSAAAADVTGDGGVSAFDASYVLRHAVDLIGCFPVESGCSEAATA
jgi:hypothetical protein